MTHVQIWRMQGLYGLCGGCMSLFSRYMGDVVMLGWWSVVSSKVIVEGRACGRVGLANARGVVLKALCQGLPYGPQQT